MSSSAPPSPASSGAPVPRNAFSSGLVFGLSLVVVVVAALLLWLRATEAAPATKATIAVQGTLALGAIFLAGVAAWCGVQLCRNLGALASVLEQSAKTQAAAERAAYFAAQAGETQRYANAVALLGGESLEVRLGGLYALERLARESKADHGPICEVLGAFVRTRAAWTNGESAPPRPATDVQAALSILGRRTREFDPAGSHLDLHGVALARAYLPFAQLAGAYLYESNLEGAILQGADLRGAWLWRANLTNAVLERAHLEGADLTGASGLTVPQLRIAHLDGKTRLPEYLRAELGSGAKVESVAPAPAVTAPVEPPAPPSEDLKLPTRRVAV